MNPKHAIFTLFLLLALFLVACSPQSVPTETMEEMGPATEVMQENSETMVEVETIATVTVVPDPPMEEEMPEADTQSEWVLVSKGQFQGADEVHQGSGTASIFQQMGQRVLRFEEFEVTDGPDLHIMLVENIAATSHDELGNYVDLGSLKGNIGDQDYEIAPDLDLTQYEGVMIYCVPFEVVFAVAPLEK